MSLPELGPHTGRTPVLIDDIVSTGHTLSATIRRLLELGQPAPVCVAVHGIFAEGALVALGNAGAARIVTCNTIAHPSNAIDVSALLASAAQDLLADQQRTVGMREGCA